MSGARITLFRTPRGQTYSQTNGQTKRWTDRGQWERQTDGEEGRGDMEKKEYLIGDATGEWSTFPIIKFRLSFNAIRLVEEDPHSSVYSLRNFSIPFFSPPSSFLFLSLSLSDMVPFPQIRIAGWIILLQLVAKLHPDTRQLGDSRHSCARPTWSADQWHFVFDLNPKTVPRRRFGFHPYIHLVRMCTDCCRKEFKRYNNGFLLFSVYWCNLI